MNRSRIKDIAKKVGVSVGTVDRVIHNRGEVAASTRKKILKAIEELEYQPNLFARSLAFGKTWQMAAVIPKEPGKNPYWDAPKQGISKAWEELKGFGVNTNFYFFDTVDPNTFIEKSKEALESKPDGVLFAPIFLRESQAYADLLTKKNIPFVLVNNDLNVEGKIGYFGQDCYQSGKVAAHLLSYGADTLGNFLIVHVARESGNAQHLIEKESGFRDFILSKNPKAQIHKIEDSNWFQQGFEKALEEAIEQIPNLKGIFVTTSKVHEVAFAKDKVRKSGIRLVGYDLVKDNIKFLKKGKIDFLIGQKPQEQGYQGLMALFDHLVQKRPVAKLNFVPIDIITPENLSSFLDA